ncbi:MAG: response regulator transcription factor [Myxococcales bacterium]|nr:response regulator transcription factor [Myxococcota bacterium]MDW8283979.1 response regulator transcription factor [Myxococcales bacterium]
MIRLLLVDDHAIVRAGLRALLEGEADLQVIGEAGDGHTAVELAARLQPDLVLLDLSMPGGNGIDAIARLRTAAPRARLLVLSMHAAPEYVRPALRAGVHGYLVKGSGLADLLAAIRAVAAGERFLGPEARQIQDCDAQQGAAEPDDLDRLTPRERQVLQLVAEGYTNRQIAHLLGLSPKTVDTHRTSLMRKLDLHDAQGLTRFALRRGLILPE